MLKFLRKYQLIILVVGGSLLMVVFLLQPVLTQLAPDPGKARVATIGHDNAKVTARQRGLAFAELNAIAMFMPELLMAGQMGIGLDPKNPDAPDHWFLLSREAEKAGFVGGPLDGATWSLELAPMLAQQVAIREAQQGQITSEEQFQQRSIELASIVSNNLDQRIDQIAAANGMTPEQVQIALAKCRGVRRMINFYGRAPKPSLAEAVSQARRSLDAVQVDVLTIPAGRLTDESEPIPEADLEAFFNEYRDDEPGDNPYGYSYKLPPRIKLTYLTLDAPAIAAALTPDRIEMNKRWRADRDRYPGEFADEAANVEADWRAAEAQRIIADADQVVRAEVRRAMQGVPQSGGVYTLPEGWTAPDFEPIAQRVADEIAAAHNLRIPLPPVRTITDRWVTAGDINTMPDLGRAVFRVGSRVQQSLFLPQMVTDPSPAFALAPQLNVPIVDQAASNADGSRIYITVLDAKGRSAAESIDEVDRPTLERNFREFQAYQSLLERRDELLALARESGLDAVAERLTPTPTDAEEAPRAPLRPVSAALVTRDAVQRVFDSRINTPEFRDAVIARAESFDPLADPQSLDREQRFLAVDLPSARALTLVKIVAPRPLTTDTFHAQGAQAIIAATDTWLKAEAGAPADFPYSYDALKRRWNYTVLKADEDDQEPAAPTES